MIEHYCKACGALGHSATRQRCDGCDRVVGANEYAMVAMAGRPYGYCLTCFTQASAALPLAICVCGHSRRQHNLRCGGLRPGPGVAACGCETFVKK